MRRGSKAQLRQFILIIISIFGFSAFARTTETTVPVVPQQDMKRDTLTAQPPVSQPPLDLREAVAKAMDNNNAIKQARAGVEAAKWDTATVRSQLFPNLSFVGDAGNKKDSVGELSTDGKFGGHIYHQYTGNLNLTQPLFAWGALSAIRAKDFQTKANELDLEIQERTLTSNVIQTFYQVLLNQRLLEILEREMAVLNESLNTANSRLRTGRGQLLDVLTAKTQIALLKPQIESAHNALETSGAQLATYLAEPGKYELRLKGSMRGIRLADVQRKLNFKDARLPELEKVRVLREQLSENEDVTLGTHLPNVQLKGTYGSQTNAFRQLNDDWSIGWSLMVELTVPIFSGFQSIDQRRSFAEQDRGLDYQGRDLENTLALNQVSSLKTLQSKGASLVSAEDAAKLADQEIAEVRRQYRLGTIDFVQFLTIQNTALQAYSTLDQTKFDNIVAFTNYFVATGQPLSVLIDTLEEKQ